MGIGAVGKYNILRQIGKGVKYIEKSFTSVTDSPLENVSPTLIKKVGFEHFAFKGIV